MEKRISTITKEQLVANGWEITGDPVYPAEKCLTDTTHEDYDPEGGVLKLIVHRLYNADIFALMLPDGGRLDIVPLSIEELRLFEQMVIRFEPVY